MSIVSSANKLSKTALVAAIANAIVTREQDLAKAKASDADHATDERVWRVAIANHIAAHPELVVPPRTYGDSALRGLEAYQQWKKAVIERDTNRVSPDRIEGELAKLRSALRSIELVAGDTVMAKGDFFQSIQSML